MDMWMKDKNFKLEECKTLEELLVAIATNIKNDYVNFMAYISREGVVRFYENSAPFTRRMMFFEYAGGPIKLREMIRSWIMNRAGCWYQENSVGILCSKETDKKAVLDRASALSAYSHCAHYNTIAYMNREIDSIIEKNPILNDDRVDRGMRLSLMRNALKNSTNYAHYEKEFEKTIKYVVAQMINRAMGDAGDYNIKLDETLKGIF
jgi:hypothetical protein